MASEAVAAWLQEQEYWPEEEIDAYVLEERYERFVALLQGAITETMPRKEQTRKRERATERRSCATWERAKKKER